MQFEIPKKENVTSGNKIIFETLEQSLGVVPNLYAVMAYSGNGLLRYLSFHNSPSSLSIKEKEIVSLVMCQANDCKYCMNEHAYIAKMNGFSDDEITRILKGNAGDSKWNALTVFVKEVIEKKAFVSDEVIKNFFEAGYDKENMVDTVLQVSDTIAGNYLCNLTGVPIDFPLASELRKNNK